MKIMDGSQVCSCGKAHDGLLDSYILESGAVARLGECVEHYHGTKAFLLADANTFAAAGAQVIESLCKKGIAFSQYVFPHSPKPDDNAVGSAAMHFDLSCDIVIGIGSGVINDIGKVLASIGRLPYIIVATAPSVDGYASATSSMEVSGFKVSIPTKCPNVVIGDIEILKNAPTRMLLSGLGDMLAKYVSICEWRLGHLITGEYYCEEVANVIRTAVKKCTDNAAGLLQRDEAAVSAVFEGLILGGVAMNYAGISRPASGVEHYFSHVWDMRALEFGTPADFHGIQCAVGALYAARIYDRLLEITPDRERAMHYAENFNTSAHYNELRAFLGRGAEPMIAAEERDGKFDLTRHAQRLDTILQHWEDIQQIIRTEMIRGDDLEALMRTLGMPRTAADLGLDEAIVPQTFRTTKDIRDKYILSQLCWDLGILDDMM